MTQQDIPDVVIRRLPIYARSLAYLEQEGVKSVSSQELGERIGVTAAQIRKDLSYFGEFGKQGIGYDVKLLLGHIRRILGLTEEWQVALVGVGHLGEAIAEGLAQHFRTRGILISALFDTDPSKVGRQLDSLTIQDDSQMGETIRERGIRLAIVAVPPQRAQEVVDMLVESGVRGILNYAPTVVQVPEKVWVRYIDPVALLHSMTYYLAREEERQRTETAIFEES